MFFRYAENCLRIDSVWIVSGGSGKITPTRQLILCSPAKRQINFDEKDEKRSRKISETIREANVSVCEH